MKDNHTKVSQLIRQAVNICGDDFILEDAVMHLRRALRSITAVEKRRNKVNSQAQRFAEEAKKNRERWWNQIIENAKKSAEVNLEGESDSSDG